MLEQSQALDRTSEGLLSAGVAAAPRLLVIDDDKLHRMIVCRLAARMGYAPAGAATYAEAVKLTQQSTFDCIALDLSVGAHDGAEMLRHLWAVGCKAPIFVITGSDDAARRETADIARSLDLNIRAFIGKPVDLDELRDGLDRLRAERDAASPFGRAQTSPA
jgi:two-component system, chemotaxis family, chemotaxis protein CheY